MHAASGVLGAEDVGRRLGTVWGVLEGELTAIGGGQRVGPGGRGSFVVRHDRDIDIPDWHHGDSGRGVGDGAQARHGVVHDQRGVRAEDGCRGVSLGDLVRLRVRTPVVVVVAGVVGGDRFAAPTAGRGDRATPASVGSGGLKLRGATVCAVGDLDRSGHGLPAVEPPLWRDSGHRSAHGVRLEDDGRIRVVADDRRRCDPFVHREAPGQRAREEDWVARCASIVVNLPRVGPGDQWRLAHIARTREGVGCLPRQVFSDGPPHRCVRSAHGLRQRAVPGPGKPGPGGDLCAIDTHVLTVGRVRRWSGGHDELQGRRDVGAERAQAEQESQGNDQASDKGRPHVGVEP